MPTAIDDHRYMARALALAERGLYGTDPNPRVGSLAVRGGEVLGEGWHQRAGEPHAEIHALAAAGERARGATLYVTLEPCSHHGRTPPCVEAVIRAQVARVVVGLRDPNPRVDGRGLAMLRAAGIEVVEGVLAEASAALNPGFVKRMRTGRPWARVKVAASLDGRTAMASGESRWISGEAARRDVQHWRARSSAIMTGSGTVLADDPSLTVREVAERTAQPLRCVIDGELRMAPIARMLREPGETWVCTASNDAGRIAALQAAGARVLRRPAGTGRVDLPAVLQELGEHEVNELLVEAGAGLSGALLGAGLVDELLIYLAPHLLGDAGRGMFRLPGLERLDERIELEVLDSRAVGRDWRLIARPRAAP